MKSLSSSGMARRLVMSKALGLVFGFAGFFMLPYIWADADLMLRWGIVLWYVTFGAVIGLMGVMDHHPLWTGFRFPAWFRGIFMGAWLNFVLVFFAHNQMETMLAKFDFMNMRSPWWFVLEGVILGLIIDLLATKYGGEGKEIL